jgi:Undecaprenyl-phosphate galactose phosphotransferase WbaP
MKRRIEFKKIVCLVLLMLTDVSACAAAFWASFLVRNHIVLNGLHVGLRPMALSSQIQSGFVFFAAATIILIFAFEKLYVKRYSFWEETRRLLKGLSLAFIMMVMVSMIPGTFPRFSRLIIIVAWMDSFLFFPLFRLFIKKIFRKTGLWRKNVLILGTNPMARRVAREIVKNNTLCYDVAGFLSENSRTPIGQPFVEGIKIVGTLDQLGRELCAALAVKDIFIVLPDFPHKELIRVAKCCEELAETIEIVPDISTLYALGVELENVGDIIAVSVTRNLAKPWNILVKHTYELILACLALLVLMPVFMIIALAIRLDSPGPVFFKQPRIGKKNKTFMIYKFRSMFTDNERRLNIYFQSHPEARQEWARFRKLKNDDPRVTWVGRLIRTWSLDELPQLLNIIEGVMSLVGPRPYLVREKEHVGEAQRFIASVKPGMTGFWQIQGRSILSFEERIFLDEYYIRNWSLWLDVIILLKTIKVILKREGAV